jgi:hypothetical protein
MTGTTTNYLWNLTLQLPDGRHVTLNGRIPIQPGGSRTGAKQHILNHLTGQNPDLADADVINFDLVPDQL